MEDQTSLIDAAVLQDSEAVEVAVGVDDKSNGGADGGDQGGVAVSVVSGSGEAEFPAKKKRGRPRKLEVEKRQDFMAVPDYSSAPPQKRGRGRPKGSGKWQTLAASLGGRSAEIGAAGSSITPFVITLQTGEDIVQTLLSFSQRTLDSLCVLSATGTLSSAELRQPGLPGGVDRYEAHNEGWFHIVSLNGSHTYTEQGVQCGKNCLLSVHLVNAEGRFFGGAVAGRLIVAGPTLLVIGTFREQIMMKHAVEHLKPTLAAVAVPLQTVNATLPNTEANGVTAIPPVQAAPADEVIDGPDLIEHAPPPPVDQSDEAMMNGPDVNPILDELDPPVDEVYKVEMGPDVIPSGMESEHVAASVPDIGTTDQ